LRRFVKGLKRIKDKEMHHSTKKQLTLIRNLYTSHGRKKFNFCLCEGMRACSEFLKSGNISAIEFVIIKENLILPDSFSLIPKDKLFEVSVEELAKVTPTRKSQGIAIIAKKPNFIRDESLFSDNDFIIILDRISDPGNMGTIIRTLKAGGIKKLFITPGSVDPFSEKAIRSAMAAQFFIKIIKMEEDLEIFIQKSNLKNIWRTDCHAGQSLFEIHELFDKSAIIFGSEASGVIEIPSSRPVRIPMPGDSESLNVAQAVTVFTFEAVRRGKLSIASNM